MLILNKIARLTDSQHLLTHKDLRTNKLIKVLKVLLINHNDKASMTFLVKDSL